MNTKKKQVESYNLAPTLEPLVKLTKDIKDAATKIGIDEARFLVDMYYTIQEHRVATNNQFLALEKSEEPNRVLNWFLGQQESLERQCQNALKAYASADPVGEWMMSIRGIGPVISAGVLCRQRQLLNANHIAQVWSYAGLTPDKVGRKRGQKLSHDPAFKRILWLAGECLVKAQKSDDLYRRIYDQRKAYEKAKNEAGDYVDQAVKALREKDYGKDTVAYKMYAAGKLPDGHINARVKRYMVKMFLMHVFDVMKFTHEGVRPPKPYVIDIMGHADYIDPPGWEF